MLKRFPHGPKELAPLDAGLLPFEHDGGEMIFSLPNGLQGYYLSNAAGKQLDVGPTTIVSFRKRPIGKGVEIINARSCVDCHADGILSKRDQLREHIETSTLFSKDQQDVLLAMYVKQEELDEAYRNDRERFVNALKALGVTEPTPDGGLQSKHAPGDAEIITYFADKYEDELDFDGLAAEFDMTPKQFSDAIKRVTNTDVLRLGLDWVTTLEAGGTIPRNEVEQQYALLLEPLLQRRPLDTAAIVVAGSEQPVDAKPQSIVAAVPAYRKEDAAAGNKLALALNVKSTTAKVGDQLSFELSANQACELQILYVEENGNVEVVPDVMIGNITLQPGERRLIPQPGTGTLTFDTPAPSESMLAFCRVGGLGDQRLTVEKARDYVARSRLPPTRGLAINLAKQAQGDAGASSVQMVTFEIRN